MTTLILESEPTAIQIEITNEKLVVELADGRSLMVPLAWYPRLMHGTQKERQNWQLLGDGYAIEWVELDEHIGIEGLLAGRQSRESQRSFSRWLTSRAKQHLNLPRIFKSRLRVPSPATTIQRHNEPMRCPPNAPPQRINAMPTRCLATTKQCPANDEQTMRQQCGRGKQILVR